MCFDGTSNQYGEYVSRSGSAYVALAYRRHKQNTNVIENYFRLVKNDEQWTYYNSGIGTFAWPSYKSMGYAYQLVLNKLDLAFALSAMSFPEPRVQILMICFRRFDKIIIGGYRWLSNHYRPGDRIYLLGEPII